MTDRDHWELRMLMLKTSMQAGVLYLALCVACALSSCTPSDETAARALRSAGYSNVTLTGYPFFECGSDDEFNVGFVATSVTGVRVEGAVCCGLMKNCTVRTR